MKRLVLLGLCSALSLVMVLGTVFSSSPGAFSVDMGGTMDSGGGNDGNNMPPPEDAPATTDTLTAGGGSDNDDDDGENDDNSGGSGDEDNADPGGDKDEDNDKDNPQLPEDAPATTNALTANKIECPEGQEVPLFSTTCEPPGSDSTQDSTSAATVCPPSPANPANCPPGTNQPTAKYEPPASVLPFRGDEPTLINFYAIPVPDPDAVVRIDKIGTGTVTTFADGTIRTTTQEPNTMPFMEGTMIEKTIITPGPRTPLDALHVERVDGTSFIRTNGDRSPYSPFNIQYNDGVTTGYSTYYGENDRSIDIRTINYEDGKGNKKLITVDYIHGETSVIDLNDHSVTYYPKDGNTYTEYPRAADGTQKTVTMTSTGEPVLTVRDANDNIIPPKE